MIGDIHNYWIHCPYNTDETKTVVNGVPAVLNWGYTAVVNGLPACALHADRRLLAPLNATA
jgi:hypothetical protein